MDFEQYFERFVRDEKMSKVRGNEAADKNGIKKKFRASLFEFPLKNVSAGLKGMSFQIVTKPGF